LTKEIDCDIIVDIGGKKTMKEEQIANEMRNLIQSVAIAMEGVEELKKIDFAIFYKDGQLSFVNLELFKEEVEKTKLNKNLTK
jgi:uncharacterized membrane protein YcaP (DUF421 family)